MKLVSLVTALALALTPVVATAQSGDQGPQRAGAPLRGGAAVPIVASTIPEGALAGVGLGGIIVACIVFCFNDDDDGPVSTPTTPSTPTN